MGLVNHKGLELFLLISLILSFVAFMIYLIMYTLCLRAKNIPKRHLRSWVPSILNGVRPGRSSEMIFSTDDLHHGSVSQFSTTTPSNPSLNHNAVPDESEIEIDGNAILNFNVSYTTHSENKMELNSKLNMNIPTCSTIETTNQFQYLSENENERNDCAMLTI